MTVTWIDLEGAHNARDLGGLRAGDGHTRHGVLLRADALDGLTALDVDLLTNQHGLAQVIDLRSSHERVGRPPSPLTRAGLPHVELEVIGPDDLARRAESRARAVEAGLEPHTVLADGYVELLELGADAFSYAFRAVNTSEDAPTLVHCSIGKDRTGVLTALLLSAAGVDEDEIAADYARSGERMSPIIDRWMSETPSRMTDQLAAFTASADARTMLLVLDHLNDRWGGGGGYLQAHGHTADAIEQWRRRLVA